MGLKRARIMVALSSFAFAVMMSSTASAQFIDDGPTRTDFTQNGVFDTQGYTAALITFQTAPLLTIDGPITLSVRDCPAGNSLSAEFVGYPGSRVTVTSVGTPTSIVITPPQGIEEGFNIIRLTCGPAVLLLTSAEAKPLTSTFVRDVIVNLQPTGTPGVKNSLTVSLVSAPGGGGLPRTGSDQRTIMGLAAAALLLGGAVMFGAQRRFSPAT